MVTCILTSSFLTHVVVKVFVGFLFANHSHGACCARNHALYVVDGMRRNLVLIRFRHFLFQKHAKVQLQKTQRVFA